MIQSHNEGRAARGTFSPVLDASFTIDEWCAHRRVCRAMFYKLAAQGKAPKTHHAGRKRLISPAADAAWLAEREAEAA
jgi:hypothetical protein